MNALEDLAMNNTFLCSFTWDSTGTWFVYVNENNGREAPSREEGREEECGLRIEQLFSSHCYLKKKQEF